MEVLTQIGLWDFLSLPTGTEILRGGTPLGDETLSQGFLLSDVRFRSSLKGSAPLDANTNPTLLYGFPPLGRFNP